MERKRLLIEAAWEVCNQVGGIYTVIRSKVSSAQQFWGDRYCLIGPWFSGQALGEFEEVEDNSIFCRAAKRMVERGVSARYGRWLVEGSPRVVLLDIYSIDWNNPLHDISRFLSVNAHASELVKKTAVFGFLSQLFVGVLAEQSPDWKIVAHFHEWMTAAGVGFLKGVPNVRVVCSAHATLLGRYLAMSEGNYHEVLPQYNWYHKARDLNVLPEAQIERQAAHNCHVFTTLSTATNRECEVFLGRSADVLLPNGLNVARYGASPVSQSQRALSRHKITQFIISHFFQSYSFDLRQTLYFFTSGRYEFRNKGFDLTIAALNQLNERLKLSRSPVTVVFFFVTRKEFESLNPEVLESRGLMSEVRQLCGTLFEDAQEEFFQRLAASNGGELPDLNDIIPESERLRLRRTILHWKKSALPKIVTHNLRDNRHDPVLNDLRRFGLWNKPEDRVKVVYHPDFMTSSSPLFSMDYDEFVKGCDLGVFPSYYEPWGYTPLETIASGLPTVTSDLAGFGTYLQERVPEQRRRAVAIINRYQRDYWDSVSQLADYMFKFCYLNTGERAVLHGQAEELCRAFDWRKLYRSYKVAYRAALQH